MPAHYFNEFDPGAAAWLRELMAEGLIPKGDVDERSITEVTAADLRGYRSVHLFAGIGGWPYALRLAGWPDDRPVWTGSCPCQPYSGAGKGLGDADPRNLWPHMFRLVRECKPPVVFGEQVEGAIRHGWLDRVCSDLEGEGYAVGSAVLGAHSVGAPHVRQRLYWVADAARQFGPDREGRPATGRAMVGPFVGAGSGTVGGVATAGTGGGGTDRGEGGVGGGLGNTDSAGCEARDVQPGPAGTRSERLEQPSPPRGLADTDGGLAGNGRVQPGGEHGQQSEDGKPGVALGDTSGTGPQERVSDGRVQRGAGCSLPGEAAELSGDSSFWGRFDLIPCRDGKARRVEPGIFPLAHGIPGRVGLLRGAGNAICPQTAAEFVRAWQEATRM